MISLAEEKEADHIFVFVLIKRGNYGQARDFEKKKKYGDSTIDARYLVDAEIPIFREDNCPICYHLNILEQTLNEITGNDNTKELKHFLNSMISKMRKKKVSTIFQEDKLLKKAKDTIYKQTLRVDEYSAASNRITYVNFRWKLEQAIKDEKINMRKDISSLIENYEKHPERVFIIFDILSNEKLYFLINEKNKKALLYSKIENNILSACKYFLENIHLCNYRNIYSLINVLIEFDEKYFTENLYDIMLKSSNDDKKLYVILLMLFQIKMFQENPMQVCVILEKVIKEIKDINVSQNIEAVSQIYERKQKKNQLMKERKADRYSELRIMLHRIRHRIEEIEFYGKTDEIDLVLFNKSWIMLNEVVENFENSLNIFMNSLISKNMYKKINEFSTKLSRSFSELSLLFVRNEFGEKSMELIKVYLHRIKNLLVERNTEDGIIKIFIMLKNNLKDVCYEILEQERDRLNGRNIEYDYDFPQEPCIVFGEEKHIIEIMKNLIENVHKHSNGNKMLIKTIMDKELKTVDCFILDNGTIKDDIIFYEGLKNVDRSINICGGSFIICTLKKYNEINKQDLSFKGFHKENTVAKISLPLIKTKIVR